MRDKAQNKMVTTETKAPEERKRTGREGMLARAKLRRRAKNKMRRETKQKQRQ